MWSSRSVALVLSSISAIVLSDHPFFGHVPIPEAERPSHIRDPTKTADKRLRREDLPESLDWRDYEGNNFMPWTRNQHIPQYCGSCWSFAATTALASRIMIARGDAFPEISLSPQLVLDCDTDQNYGCHGGDALGVYQFFHENGAVEDSCAPYVAESWYPGTGERECTQTSACSYSTSKLSELSDDTDSNDEYAYAQFPRFYPDEYGYTTQGEEAMMKLLTDGPIVCVMAVDDDFYQNYAGGVYRDTTGYLDVDHEIVVLGYGYDAEEDVKYWIAMNSWGTSWGEDGYFRIERGTNNLAIEEYCIWATIDADSLGMRSLDADDRVSDADSHFAGTLGGGLLGMQSRSLKRADPEAKGVRTSPLPQDYLHADDLPADFAWSDFEGENLLNGVRQSNKPYRCDSCWAFAVTDTISDRLNVMQHLAGEDAFLEINLAPQVLINMRAGGDCDGGYAADAMQYLYDSGVPDESCQNYMAQSDPHSDNSDFNSCYTCDPDGSCYSVEPNAVYTVQEYGYVAGVGSMQSEIFARGPIACAMYVDEGFQEYAGGIYSSPATERSAEADYMVSIVGWGYDEGEQKAYWVGKNFWGIGWGENGYFRMEMGVNSNGIESDCLWGIPSVDDELLLMTRRMNEVTPDRKKRLRYSWMRWLSRLAQMSMV